MWERCDGGGLWEALRWKRCEGGGPRGALRWERGEDSRPWATLWQETCGGLGGGRTVRVVGSGGALRWGSCEAFGPWRSSGCWQPPRLAWSMDTGDMEVREVVVAAMSWWRGKPVWWGCPTHAALPGEVVQEQDLCFEPPYCYRLRNGGELRACLVLRVAC